MFHAMNRMLHAALTLLCCLILTSEAIPQVSRYAKADTSRANQMQRLQPPEFSPNQFQSNRNLINPATTYNPIGGSRDNGEELKVFGFDLFSQQPMPMQSQSADVLVLPSNYKLGPGDRVGIYLLGTVQQNLDVVVNVEGKVFLPPVGVIQASGLELQEFKHLLHKKLSPYYDNFNVDIMLLQPKNVLVAVVGDVRKPGKYLLSSLNTVLDAVIQAGGPTQHGSLRNIQLLRQGKLFATVDLYGFLMNGHNDNDTFLQAGDRIYVPLSKNRVTIRGEVKRPSIFELKNDGKERLTDLIELADGFSDFAYLDKVEISSLSENGQRALSYVNFNDIIAGDSLQNILLSNEDAVRVFSKLEQLHKRKVSIFGEIRRPGAYDLEDNMHLSDLILKSGNLTRKAYTLEAEVAKIAPGEPTHFMKVNLQHINDGTDGKEDILLDEDDQVFIRKIPKWEVDLTVDVHGEVMFPGKYAIVKDSTYLSEVLAKCGGFTEDAFLQEAYVFRPSSRIKFDKEFERLKEMKREEMSDLEYQYFVMKQNSTDLNRIVVNFNKLVYEHDKTQDIILEDKDIIVVPKAPRVVSVTGSVAKPGGVTYIPNGTFSYYLAKAGGAAWDAKLSKTKVIKVTGEVVDDEDVRSFEPGDIIWVPRKSDKKFWPLFLQTVTVAAQLASIYLIIDTARRR